MSLRAYKLAEKAVTEIARGAPGRENIRPNAVRITKRAIIAGANEALDAAARAIRMQAKMTSDLAARQVMEACARGVEAVKSPIEQEESGPRVA